jgi:hypothetical protein
MKLAACHGRTAYHVAVALPDASKLSAVAVAAGPAQYKHHVLLSACSSAQPLGTAEAWHAPAQDSAQSAGCYVSASALMSRSGLLTWQLSMGRMC